MNNDLISRSELKDRLAKHQSILDFEWDNNNLIASIIDNAPTVEQKEFEQILQPINVNIPEDIKDRLIEELSKPRKVYLDEPKTVADCITAYGDGFESARRLFERPTVEPEPVSERQKRALTIVDALTEKHLINVMERGCLRRAIILEPERPHGEWLVVKSPLSSETIVKCNKCGDEFIGNDVEDYNFCPNCGADMRKGEEE